MITRKLTIIESPYSSPTVQGYTNNVQYLRRALRHSWEEGELPFASHAFFPFFLNEAFPEERQEGIEAGYQFWDFETMKLQTPGGGASLASFSGRPTIVFYTDLGMSPGMVKALERCQEINQAFVIRTINPTKEIV